MADLRIVDAPVLLQESITDDVKMPTGGLGNFSVRLGDIVWYVVTKEQLANKNYVDLSSKSVKDSLDEHVADKNNPHQVTKAQVGLGNVDNTADIDKPVSNAVSSAIITATTDMVTKAYVNSKDGDLTTLTTNDKTNLVRAINEVVSVKADKATTLVGYGISDAYTKSEIDTNYGGVKTLYDKNVQAGAGANGWTDTLIVVSENVNQRQINDGLESIAQLASIKNPRNGQRVPVKSYHAGLGKGGDTFVYDASKADVNDGVVTYNGWVRQYDGILRPEYAGAKGDGVTDDTAAFKTVNSFGFSAVLRNTNVSLYFKDNTYVIALTNSAKYVVKGKNILGSPLATDTTETLKLVGFKIIGNGATILFDPQAEFDNLFNLDAFINYPRLTDVTIYPRRTDSALPSSVGVIFALNSGYNGKSGAKGLSGRNIEVATVAYNGIANKVRRIFEIKGTTQADQIHFSKSTFAYFKEFFYSENSESVNNVFDGSCSFFGNGSGAVYFNIVKLNDCLKVQDCNLSLTAGETLFYGRSPVAANGYLAGTAQHKIYFKDNRYEFYGSGDVIMWDSNCWNGVFSGGTLKLGGGGLTVRAVFKSFELASVDLDTIAFNKCKLLTAITSNVSYSGAANATGMKLKNVEVLKTDFSLGAFDGTNEYTMTDALANKRTFKTIDIQNLSYINNNALHNYQICPDNTVFSTATRSANEITLSKNGQVFGQSFEIPPYQCVDDIYLSTRSILPTGVAGFRIWFGNKSNNIYFDTPLINVNEIKARLKIFDGRGIIFTDVLADNIITVDALDNTGAVTALSVLSELIVKYKAVSTNAANITTATPTVVALNSNKATGIGSTAQRPVIALYLGMQYFDTSLGKPVYCSQLNPVVWRDAAGNIV